MVETNVLLVLKNVVIPSHIRWKCTNNERRTGLWLSVRQTEHIRGHQWPEYSVTVNKVIMTTELLSKGW